MTLAAKGYGVIMINPRGSNTYGQDFVKSILGDYGNHDFDDLMMGVDYILKTHPEVDADQLYVAGGSYGGFMTNWIVTHTDRFRAAVTQRSIITGLASTAQVISAHSLWKNNCLMTLTTHNVYGKCHQ